MVLSQFCSDESVNQLLNYSKCVVDQLSCNYERPKELKNIQYLIFAGLISYYGFEHIDEVTAAFKQNKFIYTKEAMVDFLAKDNDIFQETLKLIDIENACALFQPSFFYIKSKNEFYSEGRIIVADVDSYSPDELLEYTIHEVNHSVNSIKNAIVPAGRKFVNRIGLYTRDHNTNTRKNKVLEESINVLQAAEIMDHVLAFSYFDIKDSEIKYELDKMRYAVGKKREGLRYDFSTPVIRPLYENGKFNMLLKKGRVEGNVSPIISEFDTKVGGNSFATLATCCDTMYAEGADLSFYINKSNAEKLVKQYVRK